MFRESKLRSSWINIFRPVTRLRKQQEGKNEALNGNVASDELVQGVVLGCWYGFDVGVLVVRRSQQGKIYAVSDARDNKGRYVRSVRSNKLHRCLSRGLINYITVFHEHG